MRSYICKRTSDVSNLQVQAHILYLIGTHLIQTATIQDHWAAKALTRAINYILDLIWVKLNRVKVNMLVLWLMLGNGIRTFIYIIIILVILSVFSSFYYLIAICIIKRMIDILHKKKTKNKNWNEYLATVIIAQRRNNSADEWMISDDESQSACK